MDKQHKFLPIKQCTFPIFSRTIGNELTGIYGRGIFILNVFIKNSKE